MRDKGIRLPPPSYHLTFIVDAHQRAPQLNNIGDYRKEEEFRSISPGEEEVPQLEPFLPIMTQDAA